MSRHRPPPRRSPTNKASAVRVLRSIVRKKVRDTGPVSLLIARGYPWLVRSYLSALEEVASTARTEEQRRLAADALYTLGDLHDFNGAPLAAIEAYRRSVAINPQAGGAWRELGSMLANVGKTAEARRALRRALRCDPSDTYARDDLEALKDTPPLYRQGDACWEANELLARHQPEAALARLRGLRSVRARLVRLRAMGALGQEEPALQGWQDLARSRGPIMLDWGDWFFLPPRLYENPAFWSSLDAVADRLVPGVFPTLSSGGGRRGESDARIPPRRECSTRVTSCRCPPRSGPQLSCTTSCLVWRSR
jgi:hypothetical protein